MDLILKNRMNILFRCDSSTKIGSGHTMRCLTLARRLLIKGNNIIFVARKKEGDMIKLINQEFNVIELRKSPPMQTQDKKQREDNTKEQYEDWLGVNETTDASEMIEQLKLQGKNQIDWLIIDHYGIGQEWELTARKELNKCGNEIKIMVIDDLANRKYDAELILNQNFSGQQARKRYVKKIKSECKLLLGSKYALLGEEYSKLHEIVPTRKIIKRILVFFGGADPHGLTLIAARALQGEQFKNLEVDIVIGMQSSNYVEIKRICTNTSNFNCLSGLKSLAALIARADLGVGAGGSSTWERACLKLPSLVISFGEDQRQICEYLAYKNQIVWIGEHSKVNVNDLEYSIKNAVENIENIAVSIPTVDGRGADRVVNTIASW